MARSPSAAWSKGELEDPARLIVRLPGRQKGASTWHRLQMTLPVLRSVDAITIPVPGLDEGLAFYRDRLGHQLLWRNDAVGQAGLALPDSRVEVVLSTRQQMELNWLVESLDTAVQDLVEAGASDAAQRATIPVGRVAVARAFFRASSPR